MCHFEHAVHVNADLKTAAKRNGQTRTQGAIRSVAHGGIRTPGHVVSRSGSECNTCVHKKLTTWISESMSVEDRHQARLTLVDTEPPMSLPAGMLASAAFMFLYL